MNLSQQAKGARQIRTENEKDKYIKNQIISLERQINLLLIQKNYKSKY